jgi:hypothetical protein
MCMSNIRGEFRGQFVEKVTMSVFCPTRARLLQRVLCLLLCVCSWEGPVPILHTHESLRLSGLLNQHLLAHHSTSVSVDPAGVHWHFVLVRDIYGNFSPHGKSEADDSDVAVFACVCAGFQTSKGLASVESVSTTVVMDTSGSCSGSPCCRPLAMIVPGSFLVTRMQGVSMQQITMAYIV